MKKHEMRFCIFYKNNPPPQFFAILLFFTPPPPHPWGRFYSKNVENNIQREENMNQDFFIFVKNKAPPPHPPKSEQGKQWRYWIEITTVPVYYLAKPHSI